ncbi:MAG: S1C family serine protease [Labilithrix sp.]
MRLRAAARFVASLSGLVATFATPTAAQEEPPVQELPPTPPPTPAKPPKVIPAAKGELAPKCEEAFIEHVYKNTKPSVVRITRPDGGLGTGFVFHDNRHVATALHVVDLGRELKVEFPNGKVTTAEVVAFDEQHDVALLELADATDAKPLEARTNVNIGAPILAIGNPYGDLTKYVEDLEGLLNFSVSQGIVSAKSDAYIQTDAVLSPGNSGGPMLTCDGKVVGIADKLLESRIGFGVPIAHVTKLTQKMHEQKYRGRWTGKDGGVGLLFMADANSYLGFYLGGSIVGYDRIAITTRIGLGFAGKGDTTEPIVDRSIRRFFGEATVGYRILVLPFSFPFYATIGAGILGTFDRGEETRLLINSSVTPPTLVARTTSIRGGGIEPLVTAVLKFDAIEASYGFALDVIHPKYSTHQLLVGLSF